MPRSKLLLTLLAAASVALAQRNIPGLAELNPANIYLQDPAVERVAKMTPADRTNIDVAGVLPEKLSRSFADYAAARMDSGSILQSVDALFESAEKLRLNKLVANTPGPTGSTALVSRVSVPSILGFATEYGGILQTNDGNVSTLRGNLLGIAKMAFGQEQFPYCPEIDVKNCQPASRWLRRFSGNLSFGSTRAEAPTTAPTTGALFGTDYRMASWGLRFDLTANDPSDPKFLPAWRAAITKLRSKPEGLLFTEAVDGLLQKMADQDTYTDWRAETINMLKQASPANFGAVLITRLDLLIEKMVVADPDFKTRIISLRRTFMNYATVRDDLLRQIHSHRASFEYTNQHPLSQPTTSNFRFIYSHQPTQSPTLVTANFAATWYNQAQPGATGGRFRDLQIAGQLDRRLGEIAHLGNAIATFGGYYQWMKEDALITIPPGNVAPGSGIVLPNNAVTLLGTKGHIGVVQGKLTIPINGIVRVPISVTWSNRTELIKEEDLRGQIGLTFDLDNIFRR
ncbi:MAG TPA: hypothetical protein VEX68_29250 [Bryobacteraceae bacterium]|nr:hypothetical protein [Bryobacteraceae bacterium]